MLEIRKQCTTHRSARHLQLRKILLQLLLIDVGHDPKMGLGQGQGVRSGVCLRPPDEMRRTTDLLVKSARGLSV